MQKIKVMISGCSGHMGRTLSGIISQREDMVIVAGVDASTEKPGDFPVYLDPMEYKGKVDVVVDFSIPDALESLLRCGGERKIPLVLCTTGYSPEQLENISEASRSFPVFRSGNMSLGINLLLELVKRATTVLGEGFDVEIIERHHRRKIDAPSGTALMLADAVSEGMPSNPDYVYDRHERRIPRPGDEIGMSVIRGGTIVGDHEVIFAGTDEVIEIRHSAYSRDVFAVGAAKAAKFMAGVKNPGMYDMSDVLANS